MSLNQQALKEETALKKANRKKTKLETFDVVLTIMLIIALFVLLAPLIIVIGSSFHPGEYFSFPPRGLSLRWYSEFFSRSIWLLGLRNTLIVATATAFISVIVGTFSSLALARRKFYGQTALDFLILSPQLIAPIIIGISLLMLMANLGLRGTYTSVVIAHCLWTVPLCFLILQAVVKNLDWSLLFAAKDLGAGPFKTFTEVTLPLIRPGIISSFLIAFVLSMHEFIISLFLTTPATRTLPIIIWTSLRYELSPIIGAVSVMMMIMVLIALVVIAKMIGLDKIKFGA